MALNCSEVSLTPCKHEVPLWLLCRLQRGKNLTDKLYNKWVFLKYFGDIINVIKILFLLLSAPSLSPTWNLSKKFSWTGRSLWGGEGRYYWTRKLLIIQIQRGADEHRQAVRFNIYPENRNKKKKKNITSPSLTGPTSHLHSDQTS